MWTTNISLAENSILHGIASHICIKFHILREMILNKKIKLKYCPTEDQVADVMTKSFQKGRFEQYENFNGTIAKEENVNNY